MKHLFIPYELAVIAKEKGFNEHCLAYYVSENICEGYDHVIEIMEFDNIQSISHMKSPLYQQIIDWLDSVHKIRISLSYCKTSGKYRYDIYQYVDNQWVGDYNLTSFYSSEERNKKAIEEAFKLI